MLHETDFAWEVDGTDNTEHKPAFIHFEQYNTLPTF